MCETAPWGEVYDGVRPTLARTPRADKIVQRSPYLPRSHLSDNSEHALSTE